MTETEPETHQTSRWRTGDMRGDEGMPRSISQVVRQAWIGLLAARIGEAAMLGLTAICLLLAAATFSGAQLARADVWVVAGVGGALCGFSWWLEHRVTRADIARKLDRKLRHQGALFTAYELELRADYGPVGRMLLGQVLTKLRRRDAMRAVRPSLVLPVVAPLLGAAALATTLEVVGEEPQDRSLRDVTAGLVQELRDVQSAALQEDGAGLALARETREVLSVARALDRELEEKRASDPAAALAQVEELDERLAELMARSPDPAALSEARSWLDSLRQVLRREAGPEADNPGGESGAEGDEGSDRHGQGAGGVTGAPGDGTMSGSTPSAGGGDDPSQGGEDGSSAAPATAVESGSSTRAWWPAEYDEVVRRWLERVERGANDR